MSNHNPWQILQSDEIYDNPWISLKEHQVINPSGGKGIYGELHFKNIAIGVLPLDEDHNTWIVGQFRFPLKAYSWEIPEGGGLLGTDPETEALRELREETGIVARKLTEIQRLHLSNSVSDEQAILYLAQDLSFGEAMPEETEALQLQKLPFREVYEMVLRGEITDSMSVAAILKLQILISEQKI